jgi:hypothetical protein
MVGWLLMAGGCRSFPNGLVEMGILNPSPLDSRYQDLKIGR